MSNVVIVKNNEGKLVGFGDKGKRAYDRFLKAVSALEPGEMLAFSYRVPRSPLFHRLHFAMLRALFEQQERFDDEYQFRKWLEVGAGHCDFVPGPSGGLVALPNSIAYEALDDEEFRGVHEGCKQFVYSERARSYLWPHLSDAKSFEMVEAVMAGFER